MATVTELCQSIMTAAQKIDTLCHHAPLADLVKEAGLVRIEADLWELMEELEEMGKAAPSTRVDGRIDK